MMQLKNVKAASSPVVGLIGSLSSIASLLAGLAAMGCGSNEQAATSHWAGKTFLLDIPSKYWTKPSKDVGAEIAPFVPQFILGIAGTTNSLTATVGTANNGVQDLCTQTQQASFNESQYPNSQIVLSQFPLRFTELDETVTPSETIKLTSTLHDLTFDNVLPPDSATTNEGKFTVTADLGELYKLFIRIQPRTLENVCATLGAADAACSTCSFKSAQECLTLGAVQLGAKPVDTTVKQVTTANQSCP